jgi:hypothetical protein
VTAVTPATGVSMVVSVPAGAMSGPDSSAWAGTRAMVPPPAMVAAAVVANRIPEPVTLATKPAPTMVPGEPVSVRSTCEKRGSCGTVPLPVGEDAYELGPGARGVVAVLGRAEGRMHRVAKLAHADVERLACEASV